MDLEDLGWDVDALVKEVRLLRMLRHKNIAGYYAAFVDDFQLYIVMPLMTGGSCLSMMRTIFKDSKWSICLPVCLLSATVWMHSAR